MKEILPKGYDPKGIEERIYAYWEQKGLFKADVHSSKPPFCIVIPPPNVTGNLHMGHALNNTLQDILCRYKRMKGFNVLWQPGTDHAGIATQNVVERELAKKGLSREEVGRKRFIQMVWEWKQRYGDIITKQLRRLGSSCDWSRERFTMDKGLSRAVKEVFIRLYEEDLIYRGDYIINWCPRCMTALADLEVEYEERDSFLYYVRYPIEGEEGYITVATTRPETMLGDTAIAVNPRDERYKMHINKRVILPIMNRSIPLIEDSYVDTEFGTGALKITPAHDPYDFEIAQRHGLEAIKVIDEKGRMNELAGPYRGMDRFECREAILQDLEKEGLFEKKEPYRHSVGHCYRCKTVIEPLLSKQWFIKIKPLAQKAIEAVKDGRTRIIPSQWEKVYYDWMENIRDWCISRQIWWGHRIPAWFCRDCGEVMVLREEPQRCKGCDSGNIEQETDVLDTWFSSALWPFSTLGWPDETEELKVFYPTSVLVTGFDILFFWVARMMMMGLHFMKDVPFRDVYIHALVRDAEGRKMSKSKGNVINPILVMDRYGTDAFRFTLASLAAQGRDIKLSEERISGYRNFVNKLWNSARFTLMNLSEDLDEDIPQQLTLADRWILTRLSDVTLRVSDALKDYLFNEAANICYQFVWHEFCDWYIEMVKYALYGKDLKVKTDSQKVLKKALSAILRILHPFMPFVTEEIWQRLQGDTVSIMETEWPKPDEFMHDSDAISEMETVKEIIIAIRNVRGEMNIAPSAEVNVIADVPDLEEQRIIEKNIHYIKLLARVRKISIERNIIKPQHSGSAVAGRNQVHVLLEDVVNLEEERERIQKEIKKAEKELGKLKRKLQNQQFLTKAPEEIVKKVRAEADDMEEKIKKLNTNLEALA